MRGDYIGFADLFAPKTTLSNVGHETGNAAAAVDAFSIRLECPILSHGDLDVDGLVGVSFARQTAIWTS